MQPERLFPISLDLEGRTCLVLGVGPVADTKARALTGAGAIVRRVTDATLTPFDLAPFDLDGISLAIDSGELPHYSALLRRLARARGVLLNSVDQPDHCDFHMPAVIRRGALQIAISTGGVAPTLARNIRQWLDRLLPQGLDRLMAHAARLRPTVKSSLAPPARRAFWNRVFDLDSLPTLAAADDISLARTLKDAMTGLAEPAAQGMVWLVGAGAGGADMITLRGLRLLERADVVLYDALIDPALLSHTRRDAHLIPVGKRCGKHSATQETINQMLVAQAKKGRMVVRLKCGDPFIFGRGGEEMDHLAAHGIRVEAVAGVTAAAVAAADTGTPLTHRGVARRITFMTGSTNPLLATDQPDWQALLTGGTVALYMARQGLRKTCAAIIKAGLPPSLPALMIGNAGRPDRQVIRGTIATLGPHAHAIPADMPCLVLIGAAVGHACEAETSIPHPASA